MRILVNDLKKFYGDAVNRKGGFLTKEEYLSKMRGSYPNFKITERQYNFLVGFTSLILNTKMTSKNTKKYIRSGESSVKKFVENHNLMVDEHEKLKPSSVSQNVNYDRQKILRFFSNDNDIMIKVRSFGWEERIAEYEKMLNMAYAEYGGNKKMLDNLALNLPRAEVNDELSEEDFEDLLSVISKYTKNHMKYVSENLPIKQVGYLIYLVSAHKLDGENLRRFKYIRALLEGNQFIELDEIDPTEIEEDIAFIEDETTIEDEEQTKVEFKETIVNKTGGLKSTRIQYDTTILSSEDEVDFDIEDIDFGNITEADLE